ncbi:hypothetical protein ACFVVM_32390 [Nocardia sp. NPDC058176]|uniref:hypothetical protein n=1 Tax=Nocardia sp. NPDC058176 TaxID=3346368 RepID=UPI0036DC4078
MVNLFDISGSARWAPSTTAEQDRVGGVPLGEHDALLNPGPAADHLAIQSSTSEFLMCPGEARKRFPVDNAFGSYFIASHSPPPPTARPNPEGKRRRRRRREAEPQTIGKNPETWPLPETEPDDTPVAPLPPVASDAEGFVGSWIDWNEPAATDAPEKTNVVDWNDWATSTTTEHSGERFTMPATPRLKDFGGGGPISRRPRKTFDDRADPGRTWAATALKIVAGAAVAVAAIGVAASFIVSRPADIAGDQATTSSAMSAPQGAPAPLPVHAVHGCDPVDSVAITTSAGPGDTSTPRGAILGFEYSYYVERDAAKARSFVTADAHVGDEAALAAGIARYPLGVRYCVRIRPTTEPSVWDVDVEQELPTMQAKTLEYTIHTTEVAPASFRIKSINYRK